MNRKFLRGKVKGRKDRGTGSRKGEPSVRRRDVNRGEGSGEKLQGTLSMHRDGYGFVKVADRNDDIFIPARYINNALHGDKVSLQLDRNRNSAGKSEGRILAVLDRGSNRIVGRFQQDRYGARLIPEEQRIGTIFMIPQEWTNGAVDRQQVVLEVTSWPTADRPPEGKVVEILGWPEDPAVEIGTVIRKFDLPFRFSEDCLREADSIGEQVTKDDLEGRVDLRRHPFITIDGESARDFDDAIFLEKDRQNYRLFVSIADLAHYVKPGTRLDMEAYLRGTSVYFPDRSLPMLPERLSNGICSLKPQQDRLTLTAELLYNRHGELLDSSFYPSLIRSHERLTYTVVKQMIVDNDKQLIAERPQIATMLEQMKQLALLLMGLRRKRGSIDFDLPEPEIVLGLTGQTEAIIKSERNLAHQLIEEFMLAANEAVAQFMTAEKLPFIYRIHEPPDQTRLAGFSEHILPPGFSLPHANGQVTPQQLQQLIASAEGRPEERLINYGLLRCMKQARYATENLKHFGLASDCYTHFTAPIRRYPDLLVHRLLKLALKRKEGGDGKRWQRELKQMATGLSEQAEHCSLRERVAMEAERDILELKKVQFMQDKLNQRFDGFISGLTSFGIFVELDQIFVEGLVHLSTLAGDIFSFDEQNYCICGKRSGSCYRLGDRVQVELLAVNPQARRIEFGLAGHTNITDESRFAARVDEEYPRLPVKGKRPVLKGARQKRQR